MESVEEAMVGSESAPLSNEVPRLASLGLTSASRDKDVPRCAMFADEPNSSFRHETPF